MSLHDVTYIFFTVLFVAGLCSRLIRLWLSDYPVTLRVQRLDDGLAAAFYAGVIACALVAM
jgi:hypothetical protein